MQYIWFGILVYAVIIESITTQLISVWFMPGALVALVTSICGGHVYLQMSLFVLISLACLTFFRKPVKMLLNKKSREKTDLECYIGKEAVVIESIDNASLSGAVRIFGSQWTARTLDSEVIDKGEVVTVTAIEGAKLICERKK